MAISVQRYKKRLEPLLEGAENSAGEQGLHCPFHDDQRRSASINFTTGLWYCQACDVGGTVRDLVKQLERMEKQPTVEHPPEPDHHEPISEEAVNFWHMQLINNPEVLEPLCRRRSLRKATIRQWQIGWNPQAKAYTIPIRDENGIIQNVRNYVLDPKNGRRKIWSINGHGKPILFPLEVLLDENTDEVIVCEGEWDAILTNQNGFAAVTRTGSAKTWDMIWNRYFRNKTVFLMHDMDRDGQAANAKLLERLAGVAGAVHAIPLPYETTDDHGKDLTDYWQDGHNLGDLGELLYTAHLDLTGDNPDIIPVSAVNVLNSFDARYVAQPLRMRVTITGKRNPPFMAPEDVEYFCTMEAGPKCNVCPMRGHQGHHVLNVPASDSLMLEVMGSTHAQVHDQLRNYIQAQKCSLLKIEVTERRAIEELYVRPSVDMARTNFGEASDFTQRKIISVGRHDTLPNSTVEMLGTIYPNPKTQHNEFQAWDVTKTESSIDKFELTPEVVSRLKHLQAKPDQRPLAKLAEISRDLSSHVTKIYGRRNMHMLMDLVWHGAVSFSFGGDAVTKGWIEALVVGDTRTGKSEVAAKLIQHYRAGEYVSCESASFAGIVGGLQQLGTREWEITWGAIPLNDRRLVVLDEVSGLSIDAIQSMSSIRSSGEAQLTKIRSERTLARTRLLWLGNPRDGARMDSYTYGVQAIRPLIGNNEDVARFDLAMSLRSSDVDSESINREHANLRPQKYTSDICEAGVLWAWSRRPEHISFTDEATAAVYEAAIDLGGRYVEHPPLIQAANIRVKLARVAVALAIRTISTDAGYEHVIVKQEHVVDAVRFIDLLYGDIGFGYKESSEEALSDNVKAAKNREIVRKYLRQNKGLSKFMRGMGHFRRQDMEEMMNLSREEANSQINRLYEWRMLTRDGPNILINPVLHDLIREVEE
jgi:hypothetical protein